MNNDNLIWLYFLLLFISIITAITILWIFDHRKIYYFNSKFFLKDYENKYVVIMIKEKGYEKYKIYKTSSNLFYSLSPGDRITKKQYKELRGV